MKYCFEDFSIDLARQELWRGGSAVDVEPMVFQLLQHLIENRERLVSKNELFTKLWNRQAVSDAALSTCIKSARRAVNDSGDRQEIIKTVHGKGFRWIAPLRPVAKAAVNDQAATNADAIDEMWAEAARRPSIAILPFEIIGAGVEAQTLSEAIPHELIATIARLRWISIIARGSSFRFHSARDDLNEIRRRLGVRYCMTGSVEASEKTVSISVTLADTEDSQVIWADRFRSNMENIHEIREKIIAQVIFAIEVQLPLSEATKVRLRSPENIDAWATYHLGLQSLYRFDESENARAVALFENALALEPNFARAYAALSFAHFKTAFMHYGSDREVAVNAARAAAEQSVDLDPMDPFTNFNMGRSLWLVGDLQGAKSWLNRSTSLSPNFAQGIYARAWTETVLGSSEIGRRLSDDARMLSPLDPLLYAMLATRAMSLAIEGNHTEAAKWSVRAANAPGAHDMISLIAIFTNELAGNREEAANWARRVLASRQDIKQDQFFRSFPFNDPGTRREFSDALSRHGISES
ncbi:winged helix-turn-helix domain-containing tetratricopeptide repeat protein [Marimonas sp. MJW-29]|uniref:Winged helix-turn-helix domain-containing tetratricopeptide repeat protein n=1 Tax=Sulfitobacter sediminis TaxID=3234186 RepID=A0ABV3RM93_9RHOB